MYVVLSSFITNRSPPCFFFSLLPFISQFFFISLLFFRLYSHILSSFHCFLSLFLYLSLFFRPSFLSFFPFRSFTPLSYPFPSFRFFFFAFLFFLLPFSLFSLFPISLPSLLPIFLFSLLVPSSSPHSIFPVFSQGRSCCIAPRGSFCHVKLLILRGNIPHRPKHSPALP